MINFFKPLPSATEETRNKLNIIYNKTSLDSKLAAIMTGYTLKNEYDHIYFYEYNRVLNTCKLVSKPSAEEVNTSKPDGSAFIRGDGSVFVYTCSPSLAQLSAHSDKDNIHIYSGDGTTTVKLPNENNNRISFEHMGDNLSVESDEGDESGIYNPANLITLNALAGLGYNDGDITENTSFHIFTLLLADSEMNVVRGNSISTNIKIQSCLFNKNKQIDECIEKFNYPNQNNLTFNADEFSEVNDDVKASYIQYLDKVKDTIETTVKSTIISPSGNNDSKWNLPSLTILGTQLLVVPYFNVDEHEAKTLMRIASYTLNDLIAVQYYTDFTLVRIHSVKNLEWMCSCYNYTDRYIQNGYTYLKVPNNPTLNT